MECRAGDSVDVGRRDEGMTRYRIGRNPDGSLRVAANPVATASRPLRPWLGRLVHLYSSFDVLGGYVNIHHTPLPEFLRLWGYARIIIYLPLGWRLTWCWLRRRPETEWTRFPRKQAL